jgi:hypothetical protein
MHRIKRPVTAKKHKFFLSTGQKNTNLKATIKAVARVQAVIRIYKFLKFILKLFFKIFRFSAFFPVFPFHGKGISNSRDSRSAKRRELANTFASHLRPMIPSYENGCK